MFLFVACARIASTSEHFAQENTSSILTVHTQCENIFFGVAYNQILLGDFGFSGRWTPGKKLPQSWGSLHYASPEIAQGLPYEGPEVRPR